MKRTLIVMRHGHAEAGRAGQADSERPLAPQGRAPLESVGRQLHEAGLAPALVLCSSARRTRETWDIVSQQVCAARTVISDELYGASVSGVFDLLATVDDDVESVMLVGHNPTVSGLVDDISGRAGAGFRPGEVVVLERSGAGWADRGLAAWDRVAAYPSA